MDKKNLVIIGASGGLGSQLAKLLENNESFNVIKLSSKNLDITSKKSVDEYFSNTKVDILLNLAAYNFDSFLHKYTLDKDESLNKQLDVNIRGSINVLSSVLPKMRSQKYGRIIFTSSIVSENPVIGTSIYGASKCFIESLMSTCCLENATHNITANCIQLGYFDGGLLYKIDENSRENIKSNIPMKRWGSIEELYSSVLFLINTPYVNGTKIKIAGGL